MDRRKCVKGREREGRGRMKRRREERKKGK